ncbi:DUF6385 domain-containing protein [Paenibacillus sp. BC26]|uniref:DUF6385 domain-containing protein n=1 Tax=Paenibacillus sp. BC26 TaxID=1881032 RepID=UPI001160D190|nr:DUF6385 domain-containing protein [Paenibacillus sp. BC26]
MSSKHSRRRTKGSKPLLLPCSKRDGVYNQSDRQSTGSKKCRPSKMGVFSERTFMNVETTDDFVPLPSQDTSNKAVYSYAIVNDGCEPASVQLEIGPNGRDYVVETEGVVQIKGMGVIVPSRFLRYARLAVKSEQPGKPTKLCIYFQSQKAR